MFEVDSTYHTPTDGHFPSTASSTDSGTTSATTSSTSFAAATIRTSRNKASNAASLDYLIESNFTITGPLLGGRHSGSLRMGDRALAVVAAAKSQTIPFGQEIRVIHVPTGEVVFTKEALVAHSCEE